MSATAWWWADEANACHYDDVIMSAIASQITSITIVYSTVYPGADQSKHQSSASLAFVWRIVNSPHKWPVTRKMFPFDDVIMVNLQAAHRCMLTYTWIPGVIPPIYTLEHCCYSPNLYWPRYVDVIFSATLATDRHASTNILNGLWRHRNHVRSTLSSMIYKLQ